MMKELWYYAHRYRDADFYKQCDNLRAAILRFKELERRVDTGSKVLWAPWIEMALAQVPEDEAWLVIEKCVRISAGIVLDLDGADEPSPGMIRERDIMLAVGGKVEVVR